MPAGRSVIWFFVTPEAKGYARFMRSRTITLCCLAVCAALGVLSLGAGAATTLYRWVDAQGVTHYSDRPSPGAERFEVRTSTGKPALVAATQTAARPATKRPQDLYSRLEITTPVDGQVYFSVGGHLPASAAVEPELTRGHQLWFILDGTRQTDNAGDSLATSLELERGSHVLTALITDADGKQLMASAPVSFVVRQNSSASPPTGPLIPPKPRIKPP